VNVNDRTYRRKLRAAGLLPAGPENPRHGVHVPGVRGAVARYVERDAAIVAALAAGDSWATIATRYDISIKAARHAVRAHHERTGASS
jgi:hypothetical protein